MRHYAAVDTDTRFQIRTMLYLYLGIAALLLALQPVTRAGIGQVYLMDSIIGLSVLLVGLVAVGLQRIAIPVSILGYWVGVTGLMFVSTFYHYFEMYRLTTMYMFILFLGELVIRNRIFNAVLIGMSVVAIWLQFFLRADNVYRAFGKRPDLDDVIICSVLLIMASYVVNHMISRGTRLLRTVREEAREKSKRAAELKTLRNQLADILDAMSSVLISIDASGKVFQWNRKALETFDARTEEVEGCSIFTLLPHLEQYRTQISEVIATATRMECLSQPRPNGEGRTRFENITIFPMRNTPDSGAVIRIDDVTEQYQMQEMLIQSEKMMSVGGLAAGMAHEINNPLGGILNSIATIENRLDSHLPANQKVASELEFDLDRMHAYLEKRKVLQMIDRIRRSGLLAAEIVRNMLSFSRMSNQGKVSASMVELVNTCLELAATDFDLKKNYDFRRISINFQYPHSLPEVMCDPGKIQQVILNILRNGAEAMQDAVDTGTMNRTPEFKLGICTCRVSGSEMVELRITDNGPGMPESVRKRIFEPFFTTKPVGKGTGLGLSVSYFIVVNNHHGEILVESNKNKGASFVIRLPL